MERAGIPARDAGDARLTARHGEILVLRREGARWTADGARDFQSSGPAARPPADTPRAPHLAWRWDGTTLTIARDRYGVSPVFYTADDRTLAISTSIDALFARGFSSALDADAIAVFLRLGFYLGDDTPFSAIKALPPRAEIVLNGAPRVSGRRHAPPPNRLARTAAIDGYIELFRAAVRRRRHTEPVCVPLTGGRDSRHILFALLETKQPIAFAVTGRHYAPRPDEDVRIAAALADAAGIRHVALDPPTRRVDTERFKNHATSYCSDEHAQYVALARFLDTHRAPVFDGIAGDVLSAGLFLEPQALRALEAGPDALTRFVLDGYDTTAEQGIRRLLNVDAQRLFSRERAEARVARELATHLGAVNPVTSFFFWNRTVREVALAPCAIYPRGIPLEMPYLDDELFDFLAGLPAEITVDRRFHEEAIATGYPQFQHLPYERSGVERKPDRESRRNAMDFGRYARRHDGGRFLARPYLAAMFARELLTGRGQLWFIPKGLALLQAASAAASAAAR